MTNAFATVTFNADTFTDVQRLAGNAWRNAEGKGDDFARTGLAALVTTALSPLGLAVSVYAEMEPKTAKGKAAEPKESEKAAGGVSVSSLRAAKGGEGARSCLEAMFYCFDNREQDVDAVAAFIRNDKGAMRLFPLKAHLAKLKMEAAKAEREANAGEASEAKTDVEQDASDAPASLGDAAAEFAARITAASGEEIEAADAGLALLMEAVRDAYARLGAAEQLANAA